MSTITFNKDIPIDKLLFEDWEDLQKYLEQRSQLMPHETPELFAELDRVSEEVHKDRLNYLPSRSYGKSYGKSAEIGLRKGRNGRAFDQHSEF